MTQETIRPVKILSETTKRYSQAWKLIDGFVEAKGKNLPDWENWCFVPLAASYAIVSGGGPNIVQPDLIQDVAIIGALATWRLSKGIYRFDNDLFFSLWETPLNHQLPIDLFFRLPEYCLYIETPGKRILEKNLYGFFVHLEDDTNDRHIELRLLLDLDDLLFPCPVHLREEGILKSIEETQLYSAEQARIHAGLDIDIDHETISLQAQEITPLISLVLYICSTNAELINSQGRIKPNRAQAKKIKKRTKYFAAQREEIWNIGLRTGSILRSARERAQESTETETGIKGRKSPITHPRTAHWHTYWTGPRDGDQKLILKWINMILVKAEKEVDQAVLHQVEK